MAQEKTAAREEERLARAFSDFTCMVINRKVRKHAKRYLAKNRMWLWIDSLEDVAGIACKEKKSLLDDALERKEVAKIAEDLEGSVEDERIIDAFTGIRGIVLQCIFLKVLMGLEDEETAKLLLLSPDTVRVYRNRGLKEARERILRHEKEI